MEPSIHIHKHKDRPYVRIYVEELRNTNMSWKATGMYCFLCSMTEDWVIHASDLKNRKTDGRDAVYSILEELEKLGHIDKENVREKGKFSGVRYHFYEIPTDNPNYFPPLPEKPYTDKPLTGKPYTVNPSLSNNNLKEKSIKEIKDMSIATATEEKEKEKTSAFEELKEKSACIDGYALSDYSLLGKWVLNPSDSDPLLVKQTDKAISILLQLVKKEKNTYGIPSNQCISYFKILVDYINKIERFPSDEEIRYLVALRKRMQKSTQPNKLKVIFNMMKKQNMTTLNATIEPLIREHAQFRQSLGLEPKQKQQNETAGDFSTLESSGGSLYGL